MLRNKENIMKIIIKRIVIFSMLCLVSLSLASCVGCAHRHSKQRERTRHHAAQTHDEDRCGGDVDRRRKTGGRNKTLSADLSSAEVSKLIESKDYDGMLGALNVEIQQVEALKKKYLAGDMTDKEAENQLNEITETYKPIQEVLERASAEGELTYIQHKEQMKLAAKYLAVIESFGTGVVEDLVNILNDR